jgi:hypothetical protein
MGMRDALSLTEVLLTWGCLDKRRKLLLGLSVFLLDGGIKLPVPWKDPPCMLTKTLKIS